MRPVLGHVHDDHVGVQVGVVVAVEAVADRDVGHVAGIDRRVRSRVRVGGVLLQLAHGLHDRAVVGLDDAGIALGDERGHADGLGRAEHKVDAADVVLAGHVVAGSVLALKQVGECRFRDRAAGLQAQDRAELAVDADVPVLRRVTGRRGAEPGALREVVVLLLGVVGGDRAGGAS